MLGVFSGIQIPVRERPLKPPLVVKFLCPPPSPLMPQASPPHILRTSILACMQYVCIQMCLIVGVCTRTCTFVFLCVTPCASWVVLAPGVRGVLHFQLRREPGPLCGSTPAKSTIYCLQRTRRDWQCFLKNLLTPQREKTTS